MDRHTAGPLDGLWPAVAAGAGLAALDTSADSIHQGDSTRSRFCTTTYTQNCLSGQWCVALH